MANSRDPLNFYQHHGVLGFKATLAPIEQALAIYRTNRVGAYITAVSNSYPCFRFLIGDKLFEQIARNYVLDSEFARNSSMKLEDCGLNLLSWLQAKPQSKVLLMDFPFLPALLKWEWGWHCAYHTPKGVDLDHAACSEKRGYVASSYDIPEIWKALMSLARGDEVELDVVSGKQRLWVIESKPRSVQWQRLR